MEYDYDYPDETIRGVSTERYTFEGIEEGVIMEKSQSYFLEEIAKEQVWEAFKEEGNSW